MLPTGEVVVSANPPELLLTTGEVRGASGLRLRPNLIAALTGCAQTVKLRGKAVYFIRLSAKGVTDKTVEQARPPAVAARSSRARARVLTLRFLACCRISPAARLLARRWMPSAR